MMHYYRCLLEYGVTNFSWEQCWEAYKFQFLRVLIKILHVSPAFVRQRRVCLQPSATSASRSH